MIKRIIAFLLIFSLISIMVVQAIEKKQNEKSKEYRQYILKMSKQFSSSSQDSPVQAENLTDQQLENLYYQSIEADADESPDIEIGSAAPSFELKTLDGKKLRLENLRGKRVLLNFWATWCPPCKAEMPELERFYHQHKKDIEVVAVNIDSQSNVKGYAKKLGLTFPILLDEKNEVNKDYGVLSIPTTYLIDEKGKIINLHIGSMSKNELNKLYKTK
jgi:peroxiredoxin